MATRAASINIKLKYMENLKKELIDFISWIVKQPKEILSINTRELVDMYLKSINSNAHDESRSEQLVCEHPDEAIIRDNPTDYCLACNRNI